MGLPGKAAPVTRATLGTNHTGPVSAVNANASPDVGGGPMLVDGPDFSTVIVSIAESRKKRSR